MSAKRILAGVLSLSVLLSNPAGAPAQSKQEPLVEKVKLSIDNGIAWLKKEQKDRGKGEFSWENTTLTYLQPGGTSSLALLALLTAGVKPDDPVIQRGLAYLRKVEPQHVYVVGIQTMVLDAVGDTRDLDLIQRNVDWLIKAMVKRGGKFDGWGYTMASGTPDNSNTQYALLGLLAGRQSGAKIDIEVWKTIQDYYIRTQNADGRNAGGYGYHSDKNFAPTQTMTSAGVCGLLISALELNNHKQGLDEATGIAKTCGKYDENEAVYKGLQWLGRNFTFKTGGQSFYNIYGIERTGRLSGQRFIGDHDWYREGCELLTGVNPRYRELVQRDDGSWGAAGQGADGLSTISTSFALLFLSKGRTPILISKLAYNAAGADPNEWNRKHHDVRHLVEYSSRELFKREPLSWQVFDPRPADIAKQQIFDEELAGLLQSPILYMNGHRMPKLTESQEKMLQRFVDEGGFIMAEACCGEKEFAEAFRALMNRLFPDSPIAPLGPEHPVWSAHALVKPSDFQLEGIERGCKTVVIFSPQPLAGYWEENRFMPAKLPKPAIGRGQQSYRLAGNIIAYATGMELPKPRLTKAKITGKDEAINLPRHALKIVQLQHNGDAEPAPSAMRHLATYLRDTYKLDVALNKEKLGLGHRELSKFKFLYMHGRKKFDWDEEDLSNIRFNLSTGGVLLADACCGKKEFDTSFREFIAKMFPTHKLERIPLDDYLFSEKISAKPIRKVKCRTESSNGVPIEMDPFLEGIKIDGRWAVIYSRYDLGCALEKNKSTACLGHDEESAQRIAGAALIYALKR